jgi:hypothetical protein
MPLSYLFGVTLWLTGFLVTFALWGTVAVVLGVLLLGVGVVPIGLLATALNGMWPQFFSLLVMVLLTFGTRMGSIALSPSR